MPIFRTKDGTEIFYRIQGKPQGRPLILVHGWCSNLEHWSPLVNHFSRSHRVLRIDRRGMGKSGAFNHGHTAVQHAADTAELARSLGLRGAIIIGHAGGGPVTLEIAKNYKRLARAVVLIDSMISPAANINDPGDPAGAALASMISALETGGLRAFRQIYKEFFSRHCDKALVRQVVSDAARTPMPVVIDELRELATGTEQAASSITQSVLWLSVQAADQAYINGQLTQVQFGQIVGSGHFPHLEVPRQTNAMIETFIDQLDRKNS